MSGLILSAEDRAYFLQMMRRQRNSAVHRRMNVLLLLDDGWEPRQIAAPWLVITRGDRLLLI